MKAPDRRDLAIGLWLAILAVASWLALFRTPLVTEITQLLPDSGVSRDRLTLLQRAPAARLILIGIEGGNANERAAVSRHLAAALRTSGLFLRVVNGEQTLTVADLRPLFEDRYLLSPAIDPGRFDEAGLRQALLARLAELRSPLSPLQKELLPLDPTGEILTIVANWRERSRPPPVANGVWTSPDGKRALLLVETPASGFDPKTQGPLIDSLKTHFAAAKGDSSVRLLLGGPGALATLSERTIRADAGVLGMASLAAILLILALAYRSPRVLLLSPLPLISAVVVGTALVGLIFDGIHGITLGFGATLLGVSVDYPVHLFSHRLADETPNQTIKKIWPTMRLCVVTTALGYGAMLSTSFTGLAQLAIFSIAGLITAALVTRFILPALLPAGWTPIPEINRWQYYLRSGGPSSQMRRAAIAATVVLLLAAGTILGLVPPRWETDLAAIHPVPADVLAIDTRLRADLGAAEAGQMIVINAPDRERALLLSEQVSDRLVSLVEEGVLAGFDAPSVYVPSVATQRLRQEALPDTPTLSRGLEAATHGLPFRSETFAPFISAIEGAKRAEPVTPDDLAATPIGSKLNGLLLSGPSGWTALVLLTGLRDQERVAAAVQPLTHDGVAFVDFRAEANQTMARFRDTSFHRLAGGAGLLAVVLVVFLGNARRALMVLAPMVVAVAVDLSVLSLEGERLTPFHLVSLLLVVGIGIDYGLFFSRNETGKAEATRTLHALLVCSSSTAAGFSVLCFSSLPALNAVGQTVAVGVLIAFVLALVISRPAGNRLPTPGAQRSIVSP